MSKQVSLSTNLPARTSESNPRVRILATRSVLSRVLAVGLLGLLAACGGGGEDEAGGGPGGGRPGGGRPGAGFGGPPAEATSIPVRVAPVQQRRISDYLQTTGALEAENEVDVIARTTGPITQLLTEEGRVVSAGQVLARIDDRELRAELEMARVTLEETKSTYERAKRNYEEEIISAEAYDVTKARYESARAQINSREIQLSYTEIKAPIGGRVIERVVKLGEFVTNGSRLFRISDFDPLLAQVFLPEKDLVKVTKGQSAQVSVEAFGDEFFDASVLRINPVIDQNNGTFRVTLQVNGKNRLRPGMFASVLLEVDAHENALVIPKRALVLEGVGDTVYILSDGTARRREVTLGFEEANHVEILSGLDGTEQVIVLGQDSLTDGTPAYILEQESGDPTAPEVTRMQPQTAPQTGGSPSGRPGGRSGGPPTDRSPRAEAATPSVPAADTSESEGAVGGPPRGRGPGGMQMDLDDPEVVKRIRERMKGFGMSDEQIDERIEQMKKGETPGRPGGGDGRGARPGGAAGGANRGEQP